MIRSSLFYFCCLSGIFCILIGEFFFVLSTSIATSGGSLRKKKKELLLPNQQHSQKPRAKSETPETSDGSKGATHQMFEPLYYPMARRDPNLFYEYNGHKASSVYFLYQFIHYLCQRYFLRFFVV